MYTCGENFKHNSSESLLRQSQLFMPSEHAEVIVYCCHMFLALQFAYLYTEAEEQWKQGREHLPHDMDVSYCDADVGCGEGGAKLQTGL